MMESDAKAQCEEARCVIDTLQQKIEELEEERDRLLKEHGELCMEYGKVRRRIQQDEDKVLLFVYLSLFIHHSIKRNDLFSFDLQDIKK